MRAVVDNAVKEIDIPAGVSGGIFDAVELTVLVYWS